MILSLLCNFLVEFLVEFLIRIIVPIIAGRYNEKILAITIDATINPDDSIVFMCVKDKIARKEVSVIPMPPGINERTAIINEEVIARAVVWKGIFRPKLRKVK